MSSSQGTAHWFFSFAHTCGATAPRSRHRTFPQTRRPSQGSAQTHPAPGCPQPPCFTAETSLKCVSVCLASLVYHKTCRLSPTLSHKAAASCVHGMELATPKSPTAIQWGQEPLSKHCAGMTGHPMENHRPDFLPNSMHRKDLRWEMDSSREHRAQSSQPW